MTRNIFFDFDMMFDFLPALILYINKKYEIDTTLSDFNNENDSVDVIIKKHKPEITLSGDVIHKDIWDNFAYSMEWQKYVVPQADMCRIVQILADKFTLSTIVNRHSGGKKIIEFLIDKYIYGCVNGIHFIWDNEDGVFKEVSKKSFIERIPGDKIAFFGILIEEVREVKEILPSSFMFNPTCTCKRISDIPQIKTWAEIADIFP